MTNAEVHRTIKIRSSLYSGGGGGGAHWPSG